MLKKIFFLLKKIKQGKIKLEFKTPKYYNIIIYHSYSKNYLENVIENYDHEYLDVIINNITKINLSIKLVLKYIYFFFFIGKKCNFDLALIYSYSFIKCVHPKIVITSCDNHKHFSDLARLLEDEIKFLAIQNANRNDFDANNYRFLKNLNTKNNNNNFHIPYYFCFSKYEKDKIIKHKLNIKNCFDLGSINTANFFYNLNKSNVKLQKYKYDLSLISEPSEGEDKYFSNNTIEMGIIKMVKFCIKFAKDNKKKFIFLNKRKKNNLKLFEEEINFYKKNLDRDEFEYLIKNINPEQNNFASHKGLYESKLAVGMQSTLLREKISQGEKILSCNFTTLSFYNIPLEGICKINQCDFNDFALRVNKILDMNINEYLNMVKDNFNYMIKSNLQQDIIRIIRKKINNFLQI